MIKYDIREAPDRLRQEVIGHFNNYRVYYFDAETGEPKRSAYMTYEEAENLIEILRG